MKLNNGLFAFVPEASLFWGLIKSCNITKLYVQLRSSRLLLSRLILSSMFIVIRKHQDYSTLFCFILLIRYLSSKFQNHGFFFLRVNIKISSSICNSFLFHCWCFTVFLKALFQVSFLFASTARAVNVALRFRHPYCHALISYF